MKNINRGISFVLIDSISEKEMKMYLKESLQLVEDNIIIAHKGTIIAAALLYVLSIIVMYNSNN